MIKHSINKDLRQKGKARPALFFLLALFILSACPVKKTINLWLFDNLGIENSALSNKKTPPSENHFVPDSEVCNISDQVVIANPDKLEQSPLSLLPLSLAFFFLLPAFSLKALLTKGLYSYYSKLTLSKGLTPIYIRNRRLLI
jgi:hypothetical protein